MTISRRQSRPSTARLTDSVVPSPSLLDAGSVGPKGEIVIRTIAMPADTNAAGAIFGGWLMSQMDLGGAVLACAFAGSRVVTVAAETMNFVAPVNVGDLVTCYARVERVGRSSLRIAVDVWSQRYAGAAQRVTHGVFTYVAVDAKGKSRPVKPPKR